MTTHLHHDTFDIIVFIARPAAGKSEIITYLQKLEPEERRLRYHLGELCIIDDFPMLWTWFEEDHILNELGLPRLYTTADGYFKASHLWDLLIRRMCLEYEKLIIEYPDLHRHSSVLLEFSRGTEHGGYQRAFKHLSEIVAQNCCVLYVDVSFEESMRKNRNRHNPNKPFSILEHSLPDDKLIRLYRSDDWETLSAQDTRFLTVGEHEIPYAVFSNEDDVTTSAGELLGRRLQETLDDLWQIHLSAR